MIDKNIIDNNHYLVQEFRAGDMKKQLGYATYLCRSVNREVNETGTLASILKYFPQRKDRLVGKLETQNEIVKREDAKLEKVIYSFGDKIEKIENWQDENDKNIIDFLRENREISSKYPPYAKDREKIGLAYKIVVSANPVDLGKKTILRKALRELDANLFEFTHVYNTNKTKLIFCDSEIEKLEDFKQGIRNFYYTAKTVGGILITIVSHTDKILELFRGIVPEIRILSQYTRQGVELFDCVLEHIGRLENAYLNFTTQRSFLIENPNMQLGKNGRKNQGVVLGLELSDKILQENQNGKN